MAKDLNFLMLKNAQVTTFSLEVHTGCKNAAFSNVVPPPVAAATAGTAAATAAAVAGKCK